jgi:transcriptional regulator with XRE-family HTH domain
MNCTHCRSIVNINEAFRGRTVCERIRELREIVGMLDTQLCAKTDISVAHLREIELGLRDATLMQLWRIADTLGVTPAQLLDGIIAPQVSGRRSAPVELKSQDSSPEGT